MLLDIDKPKEYNLFNLQVFIQIKEIIISFKIRINFLIDNVIIIIFTLKIIMAK